ncbi:MAG: hypothetical protein IJF71_04115, partial [Clostridia bacterium]|nr:hypothetical protein [Clostridia bacterium]
MEKITYRNKAFWAFNGSLQVDEIRSQVREFASAGYGGVFLHARGGLKVPYLGKEWMAACRAAITEAEKYGLEVWLYDEDGWPSGFAGGLVNGKGEDYCAKGICCCTGE